MLTPKAKRTLKNKVAKSIADFVKDNCGSDEELFLTLLYYNELIATDLSRFDDIFGNESEE